MPTNPPPRESSEEMWVALWDCLLASGADVSDYAYETRTREGRSAGFQEFKRRGTVAEVVQAVEDLRDDYDAACAETEEIISGVPAGQKERSE